MTIKMVVLVFAVLYSVNSHGGIYKCIDKNGHIIYSDTVCSTKPGRQAVKVSPIEEAPHSSFSKARTPARAMVSPIEEAPHSSFSKASTPTRALVLPIEEDPRPSFFSAPIEKIKGFIKSFSNGSTTSSELPTNAPSDTQQYQCDGRTYCSQMSSCAEATFFINNCPDTKMDGDHDGIPCESQWCQ